MKRVCIVEDEADIAKTIESYIIRFAEESGTKAVVEKFESAEAFLKRGTDGVDIVFMDIRLPKMSGIDAAREMRKHDPDTMLIFITNMRQYAVEGYEVDAFDFIVKPVAYKVFAMKLRRAYKRLHMSKGKELWVSTRQGKIQVNASEVRYVDVLKHVITYHLENRTIVGSGTLKGVCDEFEGLPFAMCNRCFLVNLGYVTEVNGNTVTVGGEDLQISVARHKEFLRALNNYLGAGGGESK